MRILAVCLAAALLIGTSCRRADSFHSKAAVKAAIEAHLKQRPNVVLYNLTLEVGDVKFAADTAQAQATFRSKRAPDVSVSVNYQLRRVGDHWEVSLSTPGSGMESGPQLPASPTPSPSPAPQASH